MLIMIAGAINRVRSTNFSHGVLCWGVLRVDISDGGSINRAEPGYTGERWVDRSLTIWHGHSSWREQDPGTGYHL